MSTLDELVYYCNEPNPIGALMLVGSWGSGKTYLIDSILKEELKDTHVFVRISVFGIETIDALKSAVNKQWAKECLPVVDKIADNKIAEATKTFLGGAAKIASSLNPVSKGITDTVLSINPFDYVSIMNTLPLGKEKKKVVLVFDDLERSNVNLIDLLGCINEYCENMHFSTIVIANESELKSENDKISYSRIKEKLIARTVYYKPNFESIVESLLLTKWFDEDYTEFLKGNRQLITSIFEYKHVAEESENTETDNTIESPYNIRSLKCALNGFHRVYVQLKKAELPEIDRYLYSFISYMIAFKAGIIEKDEYGYLSADIIVRKLYPFYNSSWMFDAVRDWIHRGEWDSEKIDYEIRIKKEKLKDVESKDKLRLSRFIDLEDDIIIEGFEGFLEDVYSGNLTLDEYVNFINNAYFIREYEIEIPKEINWDKVVEGIESRFQIMTDNNNFELHTTIPERNKDLFSDIEWDAFILIRDFIKKGNYIFDKNRKLYLDGLNTNGIETLMVCRSKRFSVFDEDMAKATVKAFEHSTQYDKSIFIECFYDIWKLCDQSQDVKKQETKASFEKLNDLLRELYQAYKVSHKNIAAKHTELFTEEDDVLIEKLNIAIETAGNVE